MIKDSQFKKKYGGDLTFLNEKVMVGGLGR
jgi:hypothetical protein